ncbi:multicopper oxidase domain-containing protein [Hoeflea sp. WL0058]|uniref:Multicopper oxidase domain-containing protein n=1 Tax=Flavimaribacter sediminis TaxID=2865987 RepID=A0AAE2ZTP0_9HYPH|nr:multicopper oxidase domain-containing protein [Flavimaribacter sediminis]MBW8639422.1 multicopper oxidase domain-containing protein [Flavimaribacter sediminis]
MRSRLQQSFFLPALALIGVAAQAGPSGAVDLVDPPVAARAPDPGTSGRQDVSLGLTVAYRDGEIWNPNSQKSDNVRLRSYLSPGVEAEGLVGPTIEVRPGDTLRVHLENQLPADDPSCEAMPSNINIPHCFNSTNLHTHGLFVSPAGNSDNVLLTFRPGMSFDHEYAIPGDHPAGTFWYHPHLHGSTALQVSSGMGGALIVRGERAPTREASGDLDLLLKPTDALPFRERILVFQQLAYACRDADGRIKTEPADDAKGAWICDNGDVGGVEHYLGPAPPNQFGGGVWLESLRHTSINGVVVPTIRVDKTGVFERWRMIHAGVRDTVKLEIHKMREGAPEPRNVSASDMTAFIDEHCIGSDIPVFLVAADGLTMDRVRESPDVVMQPGYRWDALVAFPEPGRYCVLDGEDGPGEGLSQDQAAPPRVIAVVDVADGDTAPTGAETLRSVLVAAAKANIAGEIGDDIVADLQDGLRLTRFSPHNSLLEEEIDGLQEVVYNIDLTTNPVRYEINGKVFDPADVRYLTLGAVEDWVLSTTWDGHPHHIHTNPFQIVEVLDPDGRDVSGPDAIDNYTGTIDPQFRGLKGVWKDTIWVKNPAKSGDTTYKIRVRTTYRRYIGQAVMHCHILDHEDQGMMQIIEFVLSDGKGGVMPAGHHGGRK